MIAIDTSTFAAFLDDGSGDDVDQLVLALRSRRVVLPGAVLTELLSAPGVRGAARLTLTRLPILPVTDGYWARAGALRRAVLSTGGKARLGDALIAQACIDADAPLLTRDRDFGRYVAAGLRLA